MGVVGKLQFYYSQMACFRLTNTFPNLTVQAHVLLVGGINECPDEDLRVDELVIDIKTLYVRSSSEAFVLPL